MLHHAKFRQNRLNRGLDMAIFRFFKMAAILDFLNFKFKMAAAAILDSQKLKISTSGPVRGPNERHNTKFREDRSKRSRDITDFSRWRPSAILDFQKLKISTSGPVRRPNMRHRAKFREDRSNCA